MSSHHHFISYSTADATDFALRLYEALEAGPPPIAAWLDKRKLRPGMDWDTQLKEAIRGCDSLLFVLTTDGVDDACTCKEEWSLALKYKKPIVPLLLHLDAELPFRLGNRQYIDFAGDFGAGLKQLRDHLEWLNSPDGVLQSMKDRLAVARRDLRRAVDPAQATRIQDDITQLEAEIAEQQRTVDDPLAAERRVEASIRAGMERERQPEKPVGGAGRTKFINPPPGTAPTYFQDRHIETKLIADFLKNEALRLMTVVGRGGTGKTAMVCRMLKSLENGHLPDDGGPLYVDGIVYLSANASRRVTVPNLFADLCKLLPSVAAEQLGALYKNPQATTESKMRALLAAFPAGRTVLLLDNFEDLIDPETFAIRDAELDEALRALLTVPLHGVKAIITTRIAPRELALAQPGLQARIDLDKGLESPFAENILREMDADGKVGLKAALNDLLAEARERTRGYPRALEALFAILSADRDTALQDLLHDTQQMLPENVVEVLVGEAFSRLDPAAQRVMQALAVYTRPVTAVAVDYLLQPFLPGVNSAPVLNRLINMQFVRKEMGRCYLHPVDRAYAFDRIPKGDESDRYLEEAPPFTQFALLHRAADYFQQARTPREKWKKIEDLEPQLAEFDLRCEGQDYDTAALVLLEISFDYLNVWGFYRLIIQMHERLRHRLNDASLTSFSVCELGSAYYRLGYYEQAISFYEQALAIARESGNRQAEGVPLGGLGNCYSCMGQTLQAIDYVGQYLAVARSIEDRQGQAFCLGHLGNRYGDLGQTGRAIDYYEQALEIDREFEDRLSEGTDLGNLAETLIDAGRYEEAIQRAQESVKIGEGINSPLLGSLGHSNIALARLGTGDLPRARTAIEAARQYNLPENNHYVLALLGLIALRQEDRQTVQEAFATALEQTEALLQYSAQNYRALDGRGLALCGLALCEGSQHIPAAIEAFRAARGLNSDAGIVARVLRLIDALAAADTEGILADARRVASGEGEVNR